MRNNIKLYVVRFTSYNSKLPAVYLHRCGPGISAYELKQGTENARHFVRLMDANNAMVNYVWRLAHDGAPYPVGEWMVLKAKQIPEFEEVS